MERAPSMKKSDKVNHIKNEKKKVLILTTQFSIGGVQKSLIEALKILDYSKYDVTLLVRYDKTDIIHLIPDNVNVIVVEEGHYYRKPRAIYFRFASQLFNRLNKKKSSEKYHNKYIEYVHQKKIENPYKRYFKNSDFDVVISYTIHICTEMALEIPAKRHYLFFHSSDPDFHRDMNERLFDKFDNIIAVSKSVQHMLKENYPQYSDRIALISNHINQERIVKLADEYTVETKSNYIIITSVIRIDREKGADLLVESASLLKMLGISFKWFVVGDGDCREDIENQIKNSNLTNNIIITGFQNNPYPYIKCCDIYVHPAYEESFGLAILEALLLKKAIVSTDTMGARDVLDNGKYGLLVPVDAESVSKGITKLINDPALKIKFEKSYKNINTVAEKEYKQKWTAILNGEIL